MNNNISFMVFSAGLVRLCLVLILFVPANVVTAATYVALATKDAYTSDQGFPVNDVELDVGYILFDVGPYFFRSAVQFDVPAWLSDKPIRSATLKLYYFDAWVTFDDKIVQVRRATEAWAEDTLSYSLASVSIPVAGNENSEATVGGSGADFRWIRWDVTEAARLWAREPSKNFGLVIAGTDGNNTVRFISREHPDAALRPVLEIDYVEPARFEGEVSVTIEPSGSRMAGARWRIKDGEWLESGQIASNVDAGSHQVEFKAVDGWKAPAPLTVRAIGEQRLTNTATYLPVATFNIGAIPTQRVYQSTPAEFLVRHELGAGATITMVVDQAPAGAVNFNPASGFFSYTPASSDKSPFKVTFTATTGTLSAVQSVAVDPIPGLPPERAVFGFAPNHPLPDPESKDYLLVNSVSSDGPQLFNHQTRTTRAITISGKAVVFQQGHVNGLYSAFNGADDISEMNIHAETLIIRDPVRLPQTRVSIWAKELRFEGSEAKIETTPRSLTSRPEQFQHGAHGLKAGDISVHVERFVSNPIESLRFGLKGGDGQPGGFGQPGTKGISRLTIGTWKDYGCPWPDNTTTAIYEWYDHDGDYQKDEWNYHLWYNDGWKPGSGGNATAGGRPGDGGDGGNISLSLGLQDYVSALGGMAGQGSITLGGAGGDPQPAYRANRFSGTWHLNAIYFAPKGADAFSPDPFKSVGVSGSASSIGHSLSWLSPYALRLVLAHAKDLFLYGRNSETDEILAEYQALILTYQSLSLWEQLPENWRFQFSEMLMEIQAIRHRIANHLDYYGNPAGWVPMLSFEVNKAAFDQEVQRALRVMYLSYWISNSAATVEARVEALGAAKDQTVVELENLKTVYDTATERLPVLQAESSAIDGEERRRLEDLKYIQQQLEQRAKDNVEDRHKVPDWKKALGVASVICQAIPVYQPVLGAVGVGLGAVANHNPDNPLQTLVGLGTMAGAFTSNNLAQASRNFRTNLNIIDLKVVRTNGLDKFKAYVQNIGELAKPIGSKMGEIEKILKQTEIPATELEAELAKLKAESPEFQQIAAKLLELAQRKDQFVAEVNLTVQTVAKSAAELTHGLLSLDAMNKGLADGNRVLDARTMAYLQEMERRARERLLKYHYFMAKAYEYRLLKAYAGELNLTRLFDSMKAIAEKANDHTLSATDFDALKAIYEEQLSSIASGIFSDYNNNRPELSAPVRFNLTTNQLAQLNSGQSVTINLHEMGLFPLTDENVRIVNWRVADIKTHLNGNLGLFAYMDLYMRHSGVSTIANKGQYYLFRHYNEHTEQPIVWGARYDAFQDGVDPITPSAASQSLLRSLLVSEKIDATPENLLLYSRPSAWADITITKSVLTGNGADIVLDSLRLELQYDFTRKSTDQATLQVGTSTPDVIPQFTVSAMDLNGRQHALGDFNRTFSKNSILTVTAPPKFGLWSFRKWTDRFGNDLPGDAATNATLTLVMANHQAIQATYTAALPDDSDFDSLPNEWEIRYFGAIEVSDGTGDRDSDGLNDLQEYLASTNPRVPDTDGDGMSDLQEIIAGTKGADATSKFTLTSTLSTSGRDLVISWSTVQNRVYKVHTRAQFSGGWSPIQEIRGDGLPKTYTNQVNGGTMQFFRVTVE